MKLEIEEFAYDITLSELQRICTKPATFIPDWPAPSGMIWAVHSISGANGGEAWTLIPPSYELFAHLVKCLPASTLWFLIPKSELHGRK